MLLGTTRLLVIFLANYAERAMLRLTQLLGSHYVLYINYTVLACQHLLRYNAKLLAPLPLAPNFDCNRRHNAPYRHTIDHGWTDILFTIIMILIQHYQYVIIIITSDTITSFLAQCAMK